MPTAAQAAAKTNVEPGLCTKGTFSSMNRNSMVQHSDRESVTFDRYVSMDNIVICKYAYVAHRNVPLSTLPQYLQHNLVSHTSLFSSRY
jgi:hypothetical protein